MGKYEVYHKGIISVMKQVIDEIIDSETQIRIQTFIKDGDKCKTDFDILQERLDLITHHLKKCITKNKKIKNEIRQKVDICLFYFVTTNCIRNIIEDEPEWNEKNKKQFMIRMELCLKEMSLVANKQRAAYHGTAHLVDIVCSMHRALKLPIFKFFSTTEKILGVFGAAMHDLDHDGKSNANSSQVRRNQMDGFIVEIKNYRTRFPHNKSPVQEVHHFLKTRNILNKKYHSWHELAPDMSDDLIDTTLMRMTLHTEMGPYPEFPTHNAHHDELKTLIQGVSKGTVAFENKNNQENRIELLMNLLHFFDISNGARKFDVCQKWARAFTKETKQNHTTLEAMAKNQIGFNSKVLRPMVETLVELEHVLNKKYGTYCHAFSALMGNINENLATWNKFQERKYLSHLMNYQRYSDECSHSEL